MPPDSWPLKLRLNLLQHLIHAWQRLWIDFRLVPRADNVQLQRLLTNLAGNGSPKRDWKIGRLWQCVKYEVQLPIEARFALAVQAHGVTQQV